MPAIRTFALAAIASLSLAGAAHARGGETFTAALAAPAAQARIIAQDVVWTCAGATCVAAPNHGVSVRACRQFAHESGARVTAYGTAERQLTAEEIARCNSETTSPRHAHN